VPGRDRARGRARDRGRSRTRGDGLRVGVPALAAAAYLALAAVLVAVLAGCGGSDTNGLESTPAPELGGRVADAFRGAGSVHVVGDVESAGRAGSSYDLRMTSQSTTGTIIRDGHRHEIVKVGEDTYIRGDAEYWKSVGETEAADLLAGNWVLLSMAEAVQYRYFTVEGLALAVTQYTEALADPVTQAELAGADVVTASAPDGSKLWASNTGAAYPLRLEMSGSDTGFLEFSDYDAELNVTPPTDAIDLARLG
jgi:hypothetical protein